MADNLIPIEAALVNLIEELPHLRRVRVGIHPTVNAPEAQLVFDWPEDEDFATGGIVEAKYQYFLDFYFSMADATRASQHLREVLLALQQTFRRDRNLSGLVDLVELENGGRPFPVGENMVKTVIVRIRAEEG